MVIDATDVSLVDVQSWAESETLRLVKLGLWAEKHGVMALKYYRAKEQPDAGSVAGTALAAVPEGCRVTARENS